MTLIRTKILITFPRSCLPGRDLVMSPQYVSFLNIARFYNTDLPECNDVTSERKVRNLEPTLTLMKQLEEFHQKLRLMPFVSDKNFYPENIRDLAVNKNIPVKRNWTKSTESG